jgi:AcrR family transcriptional regulator
MKEKMQKAAPRSVEISTQIKNPELVQQRRQQLVKAATNCFIKRGYHSTSMRDIAKVSGLSMGNLYDYISKKEDILYLVHQDSIHSIYRKLFDLKVKEDEFEIKFKELDDIIKHALERTFEFQDEIILLYRESGSLSRELLLSMLELEREYINMIRRLLDKAKGEGLYEIEDTHFVANLIVYLIAFLSLRRWNFRDYDRMKLIDLMMSYFKRILGSPKMKEES